MKKLFVLFALLWALGCSPIATSTPGTPPTTTPIVNPPTPPTDTGDTAWLPNPSMTPGANNPDVTPATIQQTICVSGYTTSIRPPVSYTEGLKIQGIKAYGYSDTHAADYEEDHLIPLEVGGDPRNPLNLWPQPRSGTWNAGLKDTLENTLHSMICSGQLDLDAARNAIATDWVAAYRKYVPSTFLPVTPVPTEP